MPREVQVSKKISWLLRHGAEKEGLQLGPGGYVNARDVVCYPSTTEQNNSTISRTPESQKSYMFWRADLVNAVASTKYASDLF